MNRIEQTYLIPAPVEDVWRALTDPTVIEKWSGAPAVYVPEPHMEYSLWDGSIGGRILEVAPLRRLHKTWKPDYWKREDSVVTFVLSPAEGGTRVDLVHDNVEESDFEGTSEGWDIYYLGEIKRMFQEAASQPGTLSTGETVPAKPAKKKKRILKKKPGAKKTVAKKKGRKAAPKKNPLRKTSRG